MSDLILNDALYGELGLIKNKDGKVYSEFSITEEIPELGGWVNIPVMVKGQTDLDFLDKDEITQDNQEIAIKRAKARVASGAMLPHYPTMQMAINAAEKRSNDVKMQPYVPTSKEKELKERPALTVINGDPGGI
jgi:hypothetical protein